MTMCERLSDRMVAVVRGNDRWTSADLDHLASCADCGSEWRLVEQGAALGAGLPTVDSRRIAAAVRARLAAEPRSTADAVVPLASRRRRPVIGWVIGLAAAAALVMVVTRDRPTVGPAQPAVMAAGPLLGELEELTAPELESVLGELESGGLEAQVGGMDDLNSKELEEILQSWES